MTIKRLKAEAARTTTAFCSTSIPVPANDVSIPVASLIDVPTPVLDVSIPVPANANDVSIPVPANDVPQA